MSTATATPASDARRFIAHCTACEAFTNPLPYFDADQFAAEHDDDRHDGEPTTSVYRA